MKSVLNALLLGTALIAFSSPGMAQSAAKPGAGATSKAKAIKTNATRASATNNAKKPAKQEEEHAHEGDDHDVDVASSTSIELKCDHGDRITLYRNANDDSHIAMRWKQRLMRLHRVETTTGADRFESKRHGLLWIGIPSKSMLLDTRKGRQLANECRSPAQLAALQKHRPPAESLLVNARK